MQACTLCLVAEICACTELNTAGGRSSALRHVCLLSTHRQASPASPQQEWYPVLFLLSWKYQSGAFKLQAHSESVLQDVTDYIYDFSGIFVGGQDVPQALTDLVLK